jgi:hypothetical protein
LEVVQTITWAILYAQLLRIVKIGSRNGPDDRRLKGFMGFPMVNLWSSINNGLKYHPSTIKEYRKILEIAMEFMSYSSTI